MRHPLVFREGKRVPEPDRDEVLQIDAALLRDRIDHRLNAQGIFLSPETLMQLVAETNSGLHREWQIGQYGLGES